MDDSFYVSGARSRMMEVDILVVGAGPAGMFAVARLLENVPHKTKVLLIDKGKPAANRSIVNPVSQYRAGWETHDLVSGAGGAGLYSDGKVTLTLNAGSKLGSFVSEARAAEYLRYIERTLVSFDGVSVQTNVNPTEVEAYRLTAACTGLTYKHLPVRHFGSDALSKVVTRFFDSLKRWPNLQTLFRLNVVEFRPMPRGAEVYAVDPLGNGLRIKAANVVFALGKEGSLWIAGRLRKLGVGISPNRTYMGVRIEYPASKGLLGPSFDPKLSMQFEDGTKIKTHCFCRRGNVLPLRYFGLAVAGSHTPFTEKQVHPSLARETAVYGVLLGDSPTRRLKRRELFGIMKRVSERSCGRLMVQTLGDFRNGVPTTIETLRLNGLQPVSDAAPGNISALGFPMDFNAKFTVFLQRLAKLDAATIADEALVYAPAIEWWMPRIATSATLETSFPGIYVAGDGAGVSQGITSAATAGLLVADAIAANYG